jgi:hypothetical protein
MSMDKFIKEIREATAELKKFNDNHIPAHITMTVHALIEESHDSKDTDNITEYLFTHYDIMNLQFMDIILILKSFVPLLNFVNERTTTNYKGCFTYNVANLVSFETYSNATEVWNKSITHHSTLQLKEDDFKAIKFFLKKANTELNNNSLYLRYVKDIDQWKTSYGKH